MKLNTILLIVLVILIIIIFYQNTSNQENLDAIPLSNEAIQTIASIYNNQNLQVTNLKVTGNFNMIPRGSIIAFNGETTPEGWALCDGTNGTPDLRGRFILGSGSGNGLTQRNLNDKGGEENHKITIDEMPKHHHYTIDRKIGPYFDQYLGFANTAYSGGGGNTLGTDGGDDSKRFVTGDSGLDKSMGIMPPYYVLTYIMKL